MKDDPGLERLLDLDGFRAEVGGGLWVKIEARRIPPDAARPYGVVYSLTLHLPGGLRILGLDNAHFVRRSRGPGGRAGHYDHIHRGGTVRSYVYSDADTLLADFWREVHTILRKDGYE